MDIGARSVSPSGRHSSPVRDEACEWCVAMANRSWYRPGRQGMLRFGHLITAILLLLSAAIHASCQGFVSAAVYERVNADFSRGDYADAESALRGALKEHPQDPNALGMLGVVLDAGKNYTEAEKYYARALGIAPHSPSLLNNYGSHCLAIGDRRRARQVFLRVVALDPHHPNANLQLAQMYVDSGQAKEALRFLNALPPDARTTPAVQLLQARVLHLTEKTAQADVLLEQVEKQGSGDPQVQFSAGMTAVEWKEYGRAEQAFANALHADPANFDILYNLGLAAFHAGHPQRARQALEVARAQRPDDPDTLFALGRVESEQGDDADAIVLLVRARNLAPQRPDILLLMAQVSERLGFFGDAADAFAQYLKLKPDDALVQREYAFALARTPDIIRAVSLLRKYAQAHPGDARGFYELGVSETVRERSAALRDLTRGLELDPRLTAARYARAVLLYQQGKLTESLADLESVPKEEPQDASALDLLGQVKGQMNHPQQAVEAFQQANRLEPKDRKILLHYSRALLRVHQTALAQTVLQEFQKQPSEPPKPYTGLFAYLSMPVEQQRARYFKRLQSNVQMNPQDVTLLIRWAKSLLSNGRTAEALPAFDQILERQPGIEQLEDCGNSLLAHQQYAEAARMFAAALAAAPGRSEDLVSLSIAIFHTDGPARALQKLDQTPLQARHGDFYLLRAQILDAMGKAQEAAGDLTLGLHYAPTRPDLYFEAALFLTKHNQYRELLSLLQSAVQTFPDSPELLLTQAIAYGLVHQFENSQTVLNTIESRWPEWSQAYLINAIVLVGQAKSSQAKPLLQTAIALGNHDPLAYYNLALSDMESYPADPGGAAQAIQAALQKDPNDPYTQSLAGKIAYTQENYTAALQHLTKAIKLWPDMVEAHQTLSATYRALGQKDRSVAELKEVLQIKQRIRSADQAAPSGIKNLLFSVPAPSPQESD